MKKILSLLALAGLVVACQPEEINTAFTVNGAVANIVVSATDLADGSDAFQNGATISSVTTGTLSGTTVTLEANAGSALPETTVGITVTYEGVNYTQNVTIQPVLAGAVATYTAHFIVGIAPGAYTYTVEETARTSESETVYAFNGYNHNHEGITIWAENATQYALPVSVDYTVYSGVKEVGTTVEVDAFASIVELYASAYNSYSETAASLDFTVSAWAIYQAWATRTVTTVEYDIIATDGVSTYDPIGTITVEEYSTVAEYTEAPHPGHSNHYVAGGGDDGQSTIGGGIAFSE